MNVFFPFSPLCVSVSPPWLATVDVLPPQDLNRGRIGERAGEFLRITTGPDMAVEFEADLVFHGNIQGFLGDLHHGKPSASISQPGAPWMTAQNPCARPWASGCVLPTSLC